MTGPRIGSLFSGTGALDLATMDAYGGHVVWHSQYEPPDKKTGRPDLNQYAAKILAHHWPATPNLGDVTAIDWQAVLAEYGPVDILTAGFPCQDVSSAGLRAGLAPGTRSGLWTHTARAIAVLRPRLVVIENVQGLLSATASSDLEPCPYCMGDGGDEPALRALGAVLGDLASLGLDAEWACVKASEVGAPHSRCRVFVNAWPAAVDAGGLGRRDGQGFLGGLGVAGRGEEAVAHAGGVVPGDHGQLPAGRDALRRGIREDAAGRGEAPADADGDALRQQSDGQPERRSPAVAGIPGAHAPAHAQGPGQQGAGLRGRPAHASRPSAAHAASIGRGEGRPEPARVQGRPDAAERGGTTAPDAAGDTGRIGDGDDVRPGRGADRRQPASGGSPAPDADSLRRRADFLQLRPGQPDLDWGDYGPAIRRWEPVIGRPAPWPTDALGRLVPVFTEWMMGYPDGWVTCVPGLTRSAMLRALGNGIVRLQGAVALTHLHGRLPECARLPLAADAADQSAA